MMYDVFEVDKYKNEFFDQSFKNEIVAHQYAEDKQKAYNKTMPETRFVVRERQK